MYTATVQDLQNMSQRWRGWSESLQTQAVHRSYRKSAFEAASEHHRRAKAVAMLAVSFCGLSSVQERVDAKRPKKQEEFWCTDFQALRRLPKPGRIGTCAQEVHMIFFVTRVLHGVRTDRCPTIFKLHVSMIIINTLYHG